MDEEKILFDLPALSVAYKYKKISDKTKLRRLHLHKAVEVVKVLSGEIECTVNNNIFSVSKDNIVIINSGNVHQIACKIGKAEIQYIQIDIDEYYDSLFSNEHKKIFSFLHRDRLKNYEIFENKGEISAAFKGLEYELSKKNPSYELYIKAYIYMLIAFMCRNGMLYDLETIPYKAFQKIFPIIEYIENNLNEKISLEDLSYYLNVDKYYVCKLFKSVSGETLTNYINNRRITYAEELLLSTDKSISEIALECGFNSQQYFNLVFKNKISLSPSTYRKLKRDI